MKSQGRGTNRGNQHTFRIGLGRLPQEVHRINFNNETFAFRLRFINLSEEPNHREILRVTEVGKRPVVIRPPSIFGDSATERKQSLFFSKTDPLPNINFERLILLCDPGRSTRDRDGWQKCRGSTVGQRNDLASVLRKNKMEEETRRTYIKDVSHDVELVVNVRGRTLRTQDDLALKQSDLKFIECGE